MAANTCTSSTGTVTGTDPTFVVAYKTQQSQGVVLCLKYTQGTDTHITITFDVLNTSLHASDKYGYSSVDGDSLSRLTYRMYATDSLRIPLPVIVGETTIYANITFSGAGLSGAVVANMMES